MKNYNSVTPAAGEAAHDHPECARCGAFVKLREHTEHTGFCDSCAQEIASNYDSDQRKIKALTSAAESIDRSIASGQRVLPSQYAALRAALAVEGKP